MAVRAWPVHWTALFALLLAVLGGLWEHRASFKLAIPPFQATANHASKTRSNDTNDVYIVRFTRYAMANDHRRALEPHLERLHYSWLDRVNPAMNFPTDFGLIQASSADTFAVVKSTLERLAGVKDVFVDKTLRPRQILGHLRDQDNNETMVHKRSGRLQTRSTFELEGNYIENKQISRGVGTRSLLQSHDLAALLGVQEIWEQGHRGKGVKMGVFDTGIKQDHPDVDNIVERTNWTHEPTLDDGLGHGSFVAGVIAGTSPQCRGLAPEVDIHTFRVFTNDQVSFTSWFLDAFNYAIATEMDVVNLSIGGPDHLDRPFVEKVQEVTSSGIIMVSAIGNDGPLYGTLNNPADQNDVIGVGGMDWNHDIASFSSRGMSTWELPLGYGRSKPDVMAYGREVPGSRISGGCRTLSGTSVASPVVAGAVCLLASTVPKARRNVLNPASMKQALVESAIRIDHLNMYEQGQGRMNVPGAAAILANYTPRASIVPANLNLTDCPYAWPFCTQPLYAGSMPLMFNATILNGMAVVGHLDGPPEWTPEDEGGNYLDVRFEYPDILWPWSGHLAIYIRVKPEGAQYTGLASGTVSVVVASPPAAGDSTRSRRRSELTLKITAQIIPTPPREKRILWDQFHSIRYPPAYFPRDDLSIRHDILDWHGDHPHTNFHNMYDFLREKGYYLEILASPATCFDAQEYGALMIVDSEDEFYPEEITKLENDVKQHGLGLIIFADWYDVKSIKNMRFYDDNTRSWWEAATGGANVPALNDLVAPFGAAFAGGELSTQIEIPEIGQKFEMSSGSTILALPPGSYLFNATAHAVQQDQTVPKTNLHPVLGLSSIGNGRLVMYGDSGCLDSSHQQGNCHEMLQRILEFAVRGKSSEEKNPLMNPKHYLPHGFGIKSETNDVMGDDGDGVSSQSLPLLQPENLPQRRKDYNFTAASFVLQNSIQCWPNAPLKHQGLDFQPSVTSSSSSNKHPPSSHAAVNNSSIDSFNINTTQHDSTTVNLAEKSNAISDRIINSNSGGSSGGNSLDNNTYTIDNNPTMMQDSMSSSTEVGDTSTKKRMIQIHMIQYSQIFTVVGGVALLALWSVMRRRRSSYTLLLNGGGNGANGSSSNGHDGTTIAAQTRRSSGSPLLPLFWRQARERKE